MWNDEQEMMSYEERDAVLSQLENEALDEALIDLAYREALAREPLPVPDDEIPW